ncbi:helix-hairpin-helix motif family protein [Stylonychia lemnae]|uniref:DNA polymerase n=1 Tax=Stylonychia lemnae TaxID=5949 RepID=A0A078A599_STYLE|nr:helix-hairpin-helix motif family protein [Stylonychia lemnae]|eukprot:CDW77059.1 helix-hairpin-helix motif family protein [Stylonychia lemnae]
MQFYHQAKLDFTEAQQSFEDQPVSQTPDSEGIFHEKTFLFVKGVRGLSDKFSDELSQKVMQQGAKVIQIFEDIKDTLRELNFVILPLSHSKERDFQKIANVFQITPDHLTQILAEYGNHIKIVDPQWIINCLDQNQLQDSSQYELKLIESRDEKTQVNKRFYDENPDMAAQTEYEQQSQIKFTNDKEEMLVKSEQQLSGQKGIKRPLESENLMRSQQTQFQTPIKRKRQLSYSQGYTEFKRPRLDLDEKIEKLGFGKLDKLFFPPDLFSSEKKGKPLNDQIIFRLQNMIDEFKNDPKAFKEVKDLLKQVRQHDNPIRALEDLEEFFEIDKKIKVRLQDLDAGKQFKRDYIEDHLLDYQQVFCELLDADEEDQLQLTQSQRNLINIYKDLEESFTPQEGENLFNDIKKCCLTLKEGDQLMIELCGGMRRGDNELSQLDILISRKDGEDVSKLLLKIIDKLEDDGILVTQLDKMRVSDTGAQGAQIVVKSIQNFDQQLEQKQNKTFESEIELEKHEQQEQMIQQMQYVTKNRRVDIHVYPREEFAFAQLYFTGPTSFIMDIRDIAEIKGYSINDSSLTIKQDTSMKVQCSSENEIFQNLGISFIEPENRVDFKEHL